MKVYITKKEVENEYNIITVSENLVDEFEKENADSVIVKGSSIQDAMLQFSQVDKEPDTPFNPVLKKVRE